MIECRAPGKLIILGEYAVLEGAPALVQAVDRYADVRVSKTHGGEGEIIAHPLLRESQAFFFDEERLFHWTQPRSQELLPYIEPLMRALGPWALDQDRSQGLSLHLDTQAFFVEMAGERRKLGLGSSAALVVALAAAWYASRHGIEALDCERWLPTLVELHRKIQGGRGSGADVAASLYGGLIRYTTGGEEAVPSAQQLRPIANVEWMWIWLGQSASTPHFLQAMNAYRHHNPEHYQSYMRIMNDLATVGLNAVKTQNAEELLRAISEYGHVMERLGDAADAPIYTDDHRRLAQIAKRFGVAFKPSGAGGGDIAVAASVDTTALSAMARNIRAAGYQVVALGPAQQGLTIGSRSA